MSAHEPWPSVDEEEAELERAQARAQIPYMMANTLEEFERVRSLAWPDPVAAEGTDELREALAADIAHHVNPAIGWWRSADAQGETFDRTLLTDRYQRTADALIAQRIAPLLAKVQAVEALHVAGPYGDCRECSRAYPCLTRRALNGDSRG